MLIKFFDTGEIHPIVDETDKVYKFEKNGQIKSIRKDSDVFVLLNESSVTEEFADIKVRSELESYEDAVEEPMAPPVKSEPPARKSRKSKKETRDEAV